MATSYTSLLGFALPVQGELNGTWGTTVNNSITQLAEDSIAGVATQSVLSSDWTLTTTGSGAANQARMAILIATGSPGVTRNIIAPAKSKAYIVINQSNGAVIVKGSATTGVSVTAGSAALVAWNGSDFIDASPAIPSIQSSASQWIGAIAGVDTITGSLTPALTAYAAGETFRFVSAGANTGAVTININGLGAKSITKLGSTTLAAGDIPSGTVIQIVYDGTQFQLVGLAASTSTTAPQFDNDTSVATTAFVQRALGNFSGFIGYATSQVLTAANMGNWIAPTVGSLAFTLPAASSVANGSTITIYGNGVGTTIQRAGTDIISINGSGVTSLALDIYDTIQLNAGGNMWYTTYKSSIDTGTGAYVRANSPTLTGTTNVANLSATGTVTSPIIKSTTAGAPPQFNDNAGTQIGTLCRAWVNFNGVTTATIRASFNVSSVTRTAAGFYTVNFTTAMSDVNYAVNCSCNNTGFPAQTYTGTVTLNTSYAPTTSAAQVQFIGCQANNNVGAGATGADISYVMVSVFR